MILEVDAFFLEHLNWKLIDPAIKSADAKLFAIEGQQKKLGVDVMADRILLRLVFHHLKHKEEILTDIKSHLKPGGLLLVIESPTELEEKESRCPKSMKRQDVLDAFKKAGFELIDQIEIDGSDCLKYKLVQAN